MAEQRAIRRAVEAQRRVLKAEQRNNNPASEELSAETLRQRLKEFEDHLNPTKLVQDESKLCGISILDALAASGLRSLRYWKEIPGVRHVTINDLDGAAVERAMMNLKSNGMKEDLISEDITSSLKSADNKRPPGIRIQQGDATIELYRSRLSPGSVVGPSSGSTTSFPQPQWDVIDLDPYGSAAPFLDGAVQAVVNGGLLCITCTDMAALGGSHPETCYSRYSAMPIQRAPYLQEAALRILLYSVATAAAKYGRTIRPVLSVGMNFYIRVFVTVQDDKAGVMRLPLHVGHVYQSTQCDSFYLIPAGQMGGKKGTVYQAGRTPAPFQCEETGAGFKVGGPLWLGPLHDTGILKKALSRLEADSSEFPALQWMTTRDRLRGLLTTCLEELPDAPLYYKLPDLSTTLKISTPPMKDVHAALVNAGYKVSVYHKDPQAVKTNAPNNVVWDVMRAWCKKHPPPKPPKEDSPAAKILARKMSIEIDFSPVRRDIDKKDVVRFPMNPEANWGPKKAARGNKRKAEENVPT